MSDNKKTVASRMTVSRQFTKSGKILKEDSDEGLIDVFCFPENVTPATVSVNQSITINTGNYESVKVGATVAVPCYLEEMNEATVYAETHCTEFIRDKVKKIKKLK